MHKQDCALCLVQSQDRILFVREDYGLHLWTFPGGMVEPGESFAAAAVRELREETGLEGRVTGCVCLRTRAYQTIAVFTIEVTGGQLLDAVPGEIEATAWLSLEEIDQPSIDDLSGLVAREMLEHGISPLACRPWTARGSSADLFLATSPR